MTLATQDDVRWFETANSFQRHVVKRFDKDLETRNEPAKNSPNFARARSLAVDGVVDQVN